MRSLVKRQVDGKPAEQGRNMCMPLSARDANHFHANADVVLRAAPTEHGICRWDISNPAVYWWLSINLNRTAVRGIKSRKEAHGDTFTDAVWAKQADNCGSLYFKRDRLKYLVYLPI